MISPVRGSTWMWLNDGCIDKCPMPNGVADPALASPSLEISSEMDQEIVLYRASALANNVFFADSMTHMTPVSPIHGFSDPDEVVVYRPIIIIRQDCLWERMTREWQENGTASEQIPMGFGYSHAFYALTNAGCSRSWKPEFHAWDPQISISDFTFRLKTDRFTTELLFTKTLQTVFQSFIFFHLSLWDASTPCFTQLRHRKGTVGST